MSKPVGEHDWQIDLSFGWRRNLNGMGFRWAIYSADEDGVQLSFRSPEEQSKKTSRAALAAARRWAASFGLTADKEVR